MPPTIANVQGLLVKKLGKKLSFVGKSILADGTNPDLMYPVATAISVLGGSVADYSAVTSDDIGTVVPLRQPSLLGLAELYALEDIWGCMTDVTETINGAAGRTQEWSSMSREILDRIDQLQQLYKGILMIYRPLSTGTIRVPSIQRSGPEV